MESAVCTCTWLTVTTTEKKSIHLRITAGTRRHNVSGVDISISNGAASFAFRLPLEQRSCSSARNPRASIYRSQSPCFHLHGKQPPFHLPQYNTALLSTATNLSSFHQGKENTVLSSVAANHRSFVNRNTSLSYGTKSPSFQTAQSSGPVFTGFTKWLGFVLTSPCSVDGTLKSINQLVPRNNGRSSCGLNSRAVFVT